MFTLINPSPRLRGIDWDGRPPCGRALRLPQASVWLKCCAIDGDHGAIDGESRLWRCVRWSKRGLWLDWLKRWASDGEYSAIDGESWLRRSPIDGEYNAE